MSTWSGERPVARHLVVGGVEVDLGLGRAGEAAVAPADLDVAGDGVGPARAAVVDGGRPAHDRLAGGDRLDLEPPQAERLAPVPRAADPQAHEPVAVGAEHEVAGG